MALPAISIQLSVSSVYATIARPGEYSIVIPSDHIPSPNFATHMTIIVNDVAVAFSSGSRMYVFVDMNKPHGMEAIRVCDVGIQTKDFAMDPSHDFLALLEMFNSGSPAAAAGPVRIHLRKFSAPETSHPAATSAILEAPALGAPILENSLQVADDAVALFVTEMARSIFIWNWVTGQLLVRMRAADVAPHTRSFLITLAGDGGQIKLYEVKDLPDSSSAALTATLHLPSTLPGREIADLRVTTGPWVSHIPEGAPFGVDNCRRIYVFTLSFAEHEPYCFVMNGKDLLETMWIVPQLRQGPDYALEWNEWIYEMSRFLMLSIEFDWSRYVHGQRFIARDPLGTARLFDFGTSRATPPDIEGSFVQCVPSNINVSNVFDVEGGVIASSLQYSCIPLDFGDISNSYNGFMLDESRVLAMRERLDPDTGLEGNLVDVFDIGLSRRTVTP
ncbi:hypothetical protein K488DRAFT_74600 [Vararia minispora EC-137]|uniref:Uncharacterized protein n=1 Tax=Vararia minispora EC-137 TaxID=1314806 RepID=A0ACB8Q6Y5_9AGAM|nr:hypothetical protein K488DRAFT_74600 [Vararia minispora EC-137]